MAAPDGHSRDLALHTPHAPFSAHMIFLSKAILCNGGWLTSMYGFRVLPFPNMDACCYFLERNPFLV